MWNSCRHIGKIFDPFFATKGQDGTGLGLSQVYAFIQRSHGAIDIISTLDIGTEIKLYFPRCLTNLNETGSNKVEESVDVKGTETILIVDDEIALLTMAKELLKSKGFNIFCAKRASEALNVLEQESIDLLLSDVIMPGMDGYQLAMIVKEKYPNVKIQLASGFSDDRHIGLVDMSLHNNLLKKPYTSSELTLRVRELLDS